MTSLMTSVRCYRCGTIFGLEEEYHRNRTEDHRGFSCPNGHSNCYPTLTANEKALARLRRELSTQRIISTNHARNRRSAERKLKKFEKHDIRISNGTCPHCKRHFANLRRHMRSKHAEHVKAIKQTKTPKKKAKKQAEKKAEKKPEKKAENV